MTATIQKSLGNSGSGRLSDKAAIVTGAARGIGRATAVAFAHEGADVMGIDIAGPVSSTLEVEPATPEELAETGRLVEDAGARWRQARLDQRDLRAPRAAAREAENECEPPAPSPHTATPRARSVLVSFDAIRRRVPAQSAK